MVLVKPKPKAKWVNPLDMLFPTAVSGGLINLHMWQGTFGWMVSVQRTASECHIFQDPDPTMALSKALAAVPGLPDHEHPYKPKPRKKLGKHK